MPYFAEINDDNVVINVIVADQSFINTMPGQWVETDIDGVSPKNYAGVGYEWREDLGGFVGPKPIFDSWTLNESTCQWEAPTPLPNDDQLYRWDEDSLSWIAI